MRQVHAATPLLALAAVLPTGCAGAPEDAARSNGRESARAATPVASAVATPASLGGRWQIARVYMPGISAMSEAEAMRWVGRDVRFGDDSSRFGSSACASPRYAESRTAIRTLEEDYRAPASMLELSGDSIDVVTVACPSPRDELGTRAYLVRDDSLVAVWDGVFFVLGRLP